MDEEATVLCNHLLSYHSVILGSFFPFRVSVCPRHTVQKADLTCAQEREIFSDIQAVHCTNTPEKMTEPRPRRRSEALGFL